jgi:MOSC domain-containing protein YiiM
MVADLKALMEGYAQPGAVEWIGLRAQRRCAMQAVASAEILLSGLEGDHARPGKRAVTLIQAEHLPVIGAMLGRGPIAAEVLRRNLVVSGINLSALKGRQVRIGGAILEIRVICAPCSRMEEALGEGGYSAVRGHGGWCAQVIEPGPIRVGDLVAPITGASAEFIMRGLSGQNAR